MTTTTVPAPECASSPGPGRVPAAPAEPPASTAEPLAFAAEAPSPPAGAQGSSALLLLILGGTIIPLTMLRWNVGVLGWFVPVPLLLYLRRDASLRGRVLLLCTLLIAFNVQWLKVVSPPVPLFLGIMYAVPIALGWWAVYLAWDAIRRRAGERWGLYAFPALVALAETASYRLTPLGIWGAGVTTQLENLPLLQLASVAGVSGIGFMLAWVASLTSVLLATTRPAAFRGHVLLLGLALVTVFTYGSVRLFAVQEGSTLQVAGIVADLGPGPDGLPDAEAVARNTEALFTRTRTAATAGARLIVWNEAATVVEAEDEASFLLRGAALARERGIDLVLAYIVPLHGGRYRFENKYVWFSERGEVLETYLKHHPVPGEGSVPGSDPLRVLRRPYGAVAGAICYDYDFPAMALAHARLGAALVVVPSSDWNGVDPYHTTMARLRAIEGGFSVVRPVRWATSAAFDPYGRTRAALPHAESNDRVLHAVVPVARVNTVYARTGDAPSAVYLLILLLAVAASRRRTEGATVAGHSV